MTKPVGKSIGEVANYKPLVECDMEELAARQRVIQPSGGVLFARTADREQKRLAREKILELFHPDLWPDRLHMLTMPGLEWRFERLLLGLREPGWLRSSKPRRTSFCALENDRAIYFAAVAQMPGTETPDRLLQRARLPFAELGMKTRCCSYFLADIEDLMAQHWQNPWDAAWIDYTGQLNSRRLQLLQRFFHHAVRKILIVTALNGRWDQQTAAAIERAGGYPNWLCEHLSGEVLHYLEYNDVAPMAQLALRH